jgi:tRNA dimethylallyltransferase
MKVYRRLDVATAKPSERERAEIRHHCLDISDPETVFSVADFVRAAEAAIRDIHSRGRLALLSGGTALYFRALLEGLFEGPGRHPEIRRELEAKADNLGSSPLHRELAALDPAAAAKIHPTDRRRLIRALEVLILTGEPISRRQRQWAGFHGGEGRTFFSLPRYPFAMVRVTRSREELRERIRLRVERMAARGLREEAEWVFANRDRLSPTPLQAVGYKELFPFFSGQADWRECLERLCLATNRLVRGQDTWFRKFPARELFLSPGSDPEAAADELAANEFAANPG